MFTCSKQGDCPEIGKLGLCQVQLGQSLNVVVDLADGGGDLLDVDGRVVPGQSVLLVAHDDGEQAGDGNLATDLGQAEYKQV